jgi:hypothetical protein
MRLRMQYVRARVSGRSLAAGVPSRGRVLIHPVAAPKPRGLSAWIIALFPRFQRLLRAIHRAPEGQNWPRKGVPASLGGKQEGAAEAY